MADKPVVYTKPELIKKLKAIAAKGWISNARHGNHGGVGNTLEDLLGIEENNLPIPNASEWELKAQSLKSSSPTTLFHFEPSPRAIRFVPRIFLSRYGWRHKEAGGKYGHSELRFSLTINIRSKNDRGFVVKLDRRQKKVVISFDAKRVDARHSVWLAGVKKKAGLGELNPQPYWGFNDLECKIGSKLHNAFYVQAEEKTINKKKFFHYNKVTMLKKFSFEKFLKAMEEGKIFVDIDARTGHNHGTKFRMAQGCLPMLYETATVIF